MEPGSLNFTLFLGVGISSSGGISGSILRVDVGCDGWYSSFPVFVPSPHLCLLLCLPF